MFLNFSVTIFPLWETMLLRKVKIRIKSIKTYRAAPFSKSLKILMISLIEDVYTASQNAGIANFNDLYTKHSKIIISMTYIINIS